MNDAVLLELDLTFLGLNCAETLMKYQMTPKYKFNGC